MNEIIEAALLKIQTEQNFRIVYACESGSRAWGFPSEDSDYDVRFIYINRPEWYLSVDLENQPDVFEVPITGILDISGWDLRKGLKLLYKSNPPLLEWLNSPILYLEIPEIATRLRDLIPDFYSPIACSHHYLHMAQGNYREYAKGDEVWLKKYFYILRPLLAIRWIAEEESAVPMEFQTLVNRLVHDEALKKSIDELLRLKKDGKELDRGPKIPELSDFIESEFSRLKNELPEQIGPKPNVEKLNEVFRFALATAW
jgi:predicted nucleotidyltransferase